MVDLVRYGSQDPIPFKVTLSGLAVTGLTFDAADIQLSKDAGAFANIGTACTEIGLGWYAWTATLAADTQCNYGVINIKDAVGTAFDENGVVFYTGGNVAARFDGT